MDKLKHINKIKIPQSLDYHQVKGCAESGEKLANPATNLGQASRISGVNPADISILMVTIEAMSRKAASESQEVKEVLKRSVTVRLSLYRRSIAFLRYRAEARYRQMQCLLRKRVGNLLG